MEKKKEESPLTDLEMNQSSSSSSFDIRDWELVDSDMVISKKDTLADNIENEGASIPTSPSGLFLHGTSEHSGVEELLADHDRLRHTESNSSSDIDVIDESPDEGQNSLPIQSMDISFCSSEISSTLSVSEQPSEPLTGSESQVDDTEPPLQPMPPNRTLSSIFHTGMDLVRLAIDAVNAFHGERMSVREYAAIVMLISACLVIPFTSHIIKKESCHYAKLEKMESHVNQLLNENQELKIKVLDKIESGKLFGDLDEEMRDLKSENFKLHKAMQRVVKQLEEQTYAIKKGLEMKEDFHKSPYKREMSKLREQINLLRIDNEELQKQLVRIRYSNYLSQEFNQKHGDRDKDTKFYDETLFQNKKATDEKKKIHETVEELKGWRRSYDYFKKELEKFNENKETSEGAPADDKQEEFKPEESDDEKAKNKKNKNRRFYNWSWKDIKKNVRGTLGSFPKMISKYVVIDKEKVGGVLDTISHYYKKAQDKTKKILESYSVDEKTQNVKNDIWTLMGDMKNKWVDMKNKFLETHFDDSDVDEKEADDTKTEAPIEKTQPAQADMEFSDDTQQDNAPNLNRGEKLNDGGSPNIQTEESKLSGNILEEINNNYFLNQDHETLKEWESMQNVKEVNELLKEVRRRFSQQSSKISTWMFERAQHRAELRGSEDGEDDAIMDLNWYLRRSKLLKKSDSRKQE